MHHDERPMTPADEAAGDGLGAAGPGDAPPAPGDPRPPAPSYAVAILTSTRWGPEIQEYLRRIDATLEPFGGRFLVHGGAPEPREGAWSGDLVVLQFPEPDGAARWYTSPAYQEILPLRTQNATGTVALVEGVQPGHRAMDLLPAR